MTPVSSSMAPALRCCGTVVLLVLDRHEEKVVVELVVVLTVEL